MFYFQLLSGIPLILLFFSLSSLFSLISGNLTVFRNPEGFSDADAPPPAPPAPGEMFGGVGGGGGGGAGSGGDFIDEETEKGVDDEAFYYGDDLTDLLATAQEDSAYHDPEEEVC